MNATASGVTLLGGHDQVAFVLAVLVVEDHDHASGAQLREYVFDAAEAEWAALGAMG